MSEYVSTLKFFYPTSLSLERALIPLAIFLIQYIMQNKKYLASNDKIIMIYPEKYQKNTRITPE
jgi:hypothetical protein